MADTSLLTDMPFYNLTNFQLSIEFQLAKTKYTDMLENNSLQRHLMENIPEQMLNNFKCKYYDEEMFNLLVKGKQKFVSLLHINLQSSLKNYALLKVHLSNMAIDFDIIGITEAQ